MNAATIIVICIVTILAVSAVIYIIKKGGNSCNMDCSKCSQDCHKKEDTKDKSSQ